MPIANPEEVAEVHWMTRDDVRHAEDVLASLPPFLDAWEEGTIGVDCDWV